MPAKSAALILMLLTAVIAIGVAIALLRANLLCRLRITPCSLLRNKKLSIQKTGAAFFEGVGHAQASFMERTHR